MENRLYCGKARIKRSPDYFGLLDKFLKGAIVIGAGLALIYLPMNSIRERDLKAIEANRCQWVETTATKLDESQGYEGLARRIIRDDNVNLGAQVGLHRLAGIISEENNGTTISKGDKYQTLECQGCRD